MAINSLMDKLLKAVEVWEVRIGLFLDFHKDFANGTSLLF